MRAEEFYHRFKDGLKVSTDTRKIEKGDIFIALKGENFNGNAYAEKAIEQGAVAAIVDEAAFENMAKNIFLVENSLKFLQDLAHFHRKELGIKIISLTGSNGKTTTKELIAQALGAKFNVAFTQGNLNNHIGVPLTLLSLKKSHDLAVVEMGANHPREIAQLCEIAAPNFGYITNFGKAHLEGFGSEEGVVKAKSELYDFLRSHKGKAFINRDDAKQIKQTEGMETISFAFENEADYQYERILKEGKAGIEASDVVIQSNLVGNYNQNNIAAAATIARYFGVKLPEIKQAIEAYTPTINRSQTIEQNGKKIIMDAYNANPSSMEVALKHFSYYDGTKAVVLGDMFELGAFSDEEHQKVAQLAKDLNFDEIFLIGENFSANTSVELAVLTFKTKEKFLAFIRENPVQSQSILIKGSRGMQLEKILSEL
ncbi:UDP-N-acetylmuramoyl-tripeptide--D-alanyl-D-alanine ligase [Ornithobacterium rhinotracheale]|uniref:UDP-N-acetylmuramoyl-tripeptide--D-alanyl-D- alanine ligase n=1 Tax=Ornithobacterium rhinotracheale TaxID=28251 RepID=UPI00129C6AF3|nr:UDP-N-acetylmuramoyl-tripeptide--D-alanyl-D-alanine ligase [Ornithobacterium rhinotracheale]MRJ10429.1 UDP-N-acetylmuramoyl-tripeptide--D-alanyl-D-alanine ligase [Ornithobacterium rhinotracheale]